MLKPLQHNLINVVKYSYELKSKISTLCINKNRTVISCDFVSLYTNIPIDRCPLSNSSMMKSLKLCLNLTLFTFNGTLYKQTIGVAMGSPVSPIVVTLFMSHSELLIFASTIKTRFWFRYVDDKLVMIKKTPLRNFSKQMNTFLENIKPAFEKEDVHSELPFLDCLVKRNFN